LEDSIRNLEAAKVKALEQSKTYDASKLRLLEEAESRNTQLISELERELEERDQRST